ncbi:MAG TPA: glycoside hydrolase family 38 C-terminal domain-containing protein, partial [Opitutaceae bacterium]|nr:glycoside hydrolase family 38 C-terminal domain-containing protein [Opitutaceae bacterium]
QFHDLLAGTALYSDYEDLRDGVGWACETAQTSKIEALEAVAKTVDTRGVPESAVFLFNPLPWRRKALVEIHGKQDPNKNHDPITHLKTQEGRALPIQWRPSDSMTPQYPRLTAWVELPACGYKVLELAHGEPPAPGRYVENCAIAGDAFGVRSLRADDGTDLLARALGLVVIKDTSDTWGHGVTEYREEIGRPAFVSSELVEDGPITRVVRQRARWRDSEIVLDISRFAELDVIELRFVIDWREHEQILKLELPSALSAPKVFAKVPGATLRRSPNGAEEPCQDWVAVEGTVAGRDYTLGLLNQGTYSYDCLDGLLRTVLIRSAPFARHMPAEVPPDDNNAWQDQGRQERVFRLLARRGVCADQDFDRAADELQTPAEYVMDSAHRGHAGWEKSFFEVSPAGVEVLAIKRAEAGTGTIVRVRNGRPVATEAVVASAVLGLRHAMPLAPFQIKSLLLRPGSAGQFEAEAVSLLER